MAPPKKAAVASKTKKKKPPPSRQDRADRGRRAVAINIITSTDLKEKAQELAEHQVRSMTGCLEVLIMNEHARTIGPNASAKTRTVLRSAVERGTRDAGINFLTSPEIRAQVDDLAAHNECSITTVIEALVLNEWEKTFAGAR